MKTQLLIIDPQNDFLDIPGAALPVSGANADMDRVARLVPRLGSRLDAIHVTLDSHHPLDIAHPGWWRDHQGEMPAPFTLIGTEDLRTARWVAQDSAASAATRAYVQALEARGRHKLIVWPEHCLIGSWGHNVHKGLFDALNRWSRAQMKQVNYVSKGENPLTEHYSAIEAEVPDAADPHTQVNRALLARLAQADTILVAGEALSHCVANTVTDIADQLGPQAVSKLVLLTDCSSPVGGFEAMGETFVKSLTARGMRLATSENMLGLLEQ